MNTVNPGIWIFNMHISLISMNIKIENIIFFRFIEKFLLFGGIFSIIFFLPFALKALSGDIAQNRIQLVYQTEIIEAGG